MSQFTERVAECDRLINWGYEPQEIGMAESVWFNLVRRINPGGYAAMLDALWIPAAAKIARYFMIQRPEYHLSGSDERWNWIPEFQTFRMTLGFDNGRSLYFIGYRTDNLGKDIWVIAKKDDEAVVSCSFELKDNDRALGFLRSIQFSNDAHTTIQRRDEKLIQTQSVSLMDELLETLMATRPAS